MKIVLIVFFLSFIPLALWSAEKRWKINPDGSISWLTDKQIPHSDHVEMSGKRVSTVVRYEVNGKGAFSFNRGMVWPLLRTRPNDTHASLMRRLAWNATAGITANGRCMENEKTKEVRLNGMMTVKSSFPVYRGDSLELVRELFPSVTLPAFLEKYTLKNTGSKPVVIEIPEIRSVVETDSARGVDGSYRIVWGNSGMKNVILNPGDETSFSAYTVAYRPGSPDIKFDIDNELQQRLALIGELQNNLVLETPDEVVNTMFSFAKIRAGESIYETRQGAMHGPGGESYYAAIWANDQAEYINPFFPYLGYEYGNRSALNSFLHFARHMNPEYKPIPSSIIAEGLDFWNGAGDRGDAAMIAYGAARYALARGDKKEAEKLWPLIEWCLEFCRRKVNGEGVVTSDSDELEGRFPAGDANLCTSSLYYDALLSAVYLGEEIGKPTGNYERQAKTLKKAIGLYFNGNVENFETYRYYKGNDILRSWICIPLTVGIYERRQGTIDALFSPRLWTSNGLLTQAGSETFWDRSTLYALRGVFAAGETEKANDYLKFYSAERLLGEHVPYAIEAWPEGGQRHLSAESGLYCRVITEGMFGIRPIGLNSFTLTPRLPEDWQRMAIRRMHAFGQICDVEVVHEGENMAVTVKSGDKTVLQKTIRNGETVKVTLPRC